MKIVKPVLISIALFFVLLIIVVAGTYFYFHRLIAQPITNQDIIFEITKGESTNQVAADLKAKNLISSEWAFVALARLNNQIIPVGLYEIPANSSLKEVFEAITQGKTKQVKITIPEGYRTEQIAQLLESKGLVNYADFLAAAKGNEGKLFPDTYYFPVKTTVADILASFAANYQRRTGELAVNSENLIIASIVEREAINDEERPLIAGIYKNRLKLGMRLEADPTVQFGKDNASLEELSSVEQASFKFWQPIGIKDYRTVDSAYNTYLIDSLPPGPICNPGLASIEAAINYQHHNYLYFLQSGGKIYPSKTEAEHNTNRAKVLGVKF